MHAILYGPYQLNADGSVKLDSDGEPIRDKRAGTKKSEKDITLDERKTLADQARTFDAHAKWQAQSVLAQIDSAKRVLEG